MKTKTVRRFAWAKRILAVLRGGAVPVPTPTLAVLVAPPRRRTPAERARLRRQLWAALCHLERRGRVERVRGMRVSAAVGRGGRAEGTRTATGWRTKEPRP